MGKRQTRRAISVKGITYRRLKLYCEAHECSVSGLLEHLIAHHLDSEKWPEVAKEDVTAYHQRTRQDRRDKVEQLAREAGFSF